MLFGDRSARTFDPMGSRLRTFTKVRQASQAMLIECGQCSRGLTAAKQGQSSLARHSSAPGSSAAHSRTLGRWQVICRAHWCSGGIISKRGVGLRACCSLQVPSPQMDSDTLLGLFEEGFMGPQRLLPLETTQVGDAH